VSGDEGSDLDDELRRLFSDDRLTVPVAEGATGAVVAGARKRRRHRMAVAAAGGVLAVTGLVFAGAALTGIGRPLGTVTAATGLSASLTATSAPSTTPAQSAQSAQLGPFGAEGLVLGTSIKDVLQKGLQLAPEKRYPVSKCTDYTMVVPATLYDGRDQAGATKVTQPRPTTTEDRSAAGAKASALRDALQKPVILQAVIDSSGTVVQIGGNTSLRTPEGVGIGSTFAQIAMAYRTFHRAINGKEVVVTAPANPKASYVFVLDGTGLADQVWLTWDTDLICPD
jgi:hypothetical protein